MEQLVKLNSHCAHEQRVRVSRNQAEVRCLVHVKEGEVTCVQTLLSSGVCSLGIVSGHLSEQVKHDPCMRSHYLVG